jgi:hypothetical protein
MTPAWSMRSVRTRSLDVEAFARSCFGPCPVSGGWGGLVDHDAPHGGWAQLDALQGYQHTRDRLSEKLFDTTERIASYQWDLTELRAHLRALSNAMRPEVDALLEFDRPQDQSRPLLAG